MDEKKLDLSKSKLVLEGTTKEQEQWRKRIMKDLNGSRSDQLERKRVYEKRKDFIIGNQDKYTNIYGLTKKAKKGHADQTINYAGRSVLKIYHSVSNLPPHVKILPLSRTNEIEVINAQMREDFMDRVFWHNKWWKRGFKRATMNQVGLGDFAVKVYYDPAKKEIKVVQAEKMDNLVVGWRSDDALDYDWVGHSEMTSIAAIKREWGIIAKPDISPKGNESTGQHEDEWGTKSGWATEATETPKDIPTQDMAKVTEYTTDEVYAIMIGSELVELVEHGYGFNPWVIGHSFHLPGRHWSKAFVDDLMSPNIELNEAMNDVRDFIRTASNAKYVARNMQDFDPESIKTGSGQVIFVDGPDADFSSLEQKVNTFPGDTYTQRVKGFIHDLGVPEVAFGSGRSDSGRSKAIDYQSVVDIADDLRIAWELVIDAVIERIQRLGHKYFPAEYWLNSESGEFEPCQDEYDWENVLPITQSEKIVDILNKFQMGLPFRIVFEELGYKDVDAVIEMMKQESRDPDLVAYRAKLYQQMQGGLELMQRAQAAANPTPQMPGEVPPTEEMPGPEGGMAAAPVLMNSENQGRETSLPMAARNGATRFSTPQGEIERTRQNLAAQGR